MSGPRVLRDRTCETCGRPYRPAVSIRRFCSRSCANARPTPLSILFERHVRRAASPDACWGWDGAVDHHGYGRLGRNRSAHRTSYALFVGSVPAGQMVLHHCDNPPCTNPLHLHLGDQLANMREASERGRINRGDRHPDSRLTSTVIPTIRARIAARESLTAIARDYGVGLTTIWSIKAGKTWAHVA